MKSFDKTLLLVSIFCIAVVFFLYFIKNINSHTISNTEFLKMQKEIPDTFKKYHFNLKGTFMEEEIIRIIDWGNFTDNNNNNNYNQNNSNQKNYGTVKKIEEITKLKKTQKRKLVFSHKVKKGESIWSIARKYNIPIYTILSLNDEINKKIIYSGDIIRASSQKGIFYKIKKGDSLASVSKKYDISLDLILQSNKISKHKASKIFVGHEIFLPNAKPIKKVKLYKEYIFTLPIKGRITSVFGKRTHPIFHKTHFHTGIDIAASKGNPIYSTLSGIVIFSGYKKGYGKTVIIRNTKKYYTIFAHCSQLYVKKSQYVNKGDKIATVGSTGYSTGPHLHFELWKDNKAIDPVPLIGKSLYKKKIKN